MADGSRILSRILMRIDHIQIGFRYRKDLGDVRALAASIAAVGLLQPVVVTTSGRLIAGQRRMEAGRLLGLTEIPVTVVNLLQAARGEAHENFVRKDLLPSGIVALKRAIEPIERRDARPRQGSRADLGYPATIAECHAGYARVSSRASADVRETNSAWAGFGTLMGRRSSAAAVARYS